MGVSGHMSKKQKAADAGIAQRYRVAAPRSFRLAGVDPGDDGGLTKSAGEKGLKRSLKKLRALQEKFYADGRNSLLIVLQAMDAAGKDSLIEHVMSGVNPQGCDVHSFKAPSAEELEHDFLWRAHRNLPARGRIGVFNRSYYEEVLVVRVHPKLLVPQKLPEAAKEPAIWPQRFKDIVAFEDYLARNGTTVIKFHLRISQEEQRKRFLDRLNEPGKNWKFSMGDVEERKLWDDYMAAYEDMIRNTSTAKAPWFVVPGDHKWFARHVVAQALVDAIEAIDPKFPKVPAAAIPELNRARSALEAEAPVMPPNDAIGQDH
jgi:PPK2 family polyphosphate:nucleotide phosphotransferase